MLAGDQSAFETSRWLFKTESAVSKNTASLSVVDDDGVLSRMSTRLGVALTSSPYVAITFSRSTPKTGNLSSKAGLFFVVSAQ